MNRSYATQDYLAYAIGSQTVPYGYTYSWDITTSNIITNYNYKNDMFDFAPDMRMFSVNSVYE